MHYLEVVTSDVATVCALYERTLAVTLSEPVAALGGARTGSLSNGTIVGIRAPMHDAEDATTRPYYRVEDIDIAVADAERQGATVAVPPMNLPGYGRCAIVIVGDIQSGFWEC